MSALSLRQSSWFFMLVSSFCYSVVPVLMAVTGGHEAPFLWNGIYRLGGAVGAAAALVLIPLGAPVLPLVRRLLASSVRPVALVLLFPYLGYTLFSFSASVAGFAVSVVAFQLWPVLFVLMMSRWGGISASRVPLGRVGLMLMLVSAFGAVLVALSGGEPVGGLIGLGLGLAGAVSAAATVFNFRWAVDSVSALGLSGDRRLWWCLLLLFLWGSSLSSLTALCLHWALGGSVGGQGSLAGPVLLVLCGGVVLDAGGTVTSRWSNLRAASLMVNVCGCGVPVLSLLLLALAGYGGVERPLLFICGAGLVLASGFALRLR